MENGWGRRLAYIYGGVGESGQGKGSYGLLTDYGNCFTSQEGKKVSILWTFLGRTELTSSSEDKIEHPSPIFLKSLIHIHTNPIPETCLLAHV